MEQDPRWQKAQAKRKKGVKFPAIFAEKVDMAKVNREQMKRWAADRLVALFDGLEDEVLINYVGAHLDQPSLDPEELLLSLNDMLERDAASFTEELWTLLVDAQQQPGGIPKALLQNVKAQIDARMQEKDRVAQGMRHMGHISDRQRNLSSAPQERDFGRGYGLQNADGSRDKPRDYRDHRKAHEEGQYERSFESRERSDAPRNTSDDQDARRQYGDRREPHREHYDHKTQYSADSLARRTENVDTTVRSRYDPIDADTSVAPRQNGERGRYDDRYGGDEQGRYGDRRYGRGGRSRRHREYEEYDTPYTRERGRYDEPHEEVDPFGRDARPVLPKQTETSPPRRS